MEVKKKTMDLLPDADHNLAQLQVGAVSGRRCERTEVRTQSILFLFVAAAGGGEQREASGEPGRPVGKAPRSAHRGTSQAQANVQLPRREFPHTTVFGISVETVRSDVICGFVAGILQEAVRNQDFARKNPCFYRRSQGKGGNVQTTGNT